jgi:hypothetical protein
MLHSVARFYVCSEAIWLVSFQVDLLLCRLPIFHAQIEGRDATLRLQNFLGTQFV